MLLVSSSIKESCSTLEQYKLTLRRHASPEYPRTLERAGLVEPSLESPSSPEPPSGGDTSPEK